MLEFRVWFKNNHEPPRIAINLTGRQIGRMKSFKRILDLLITRNLQPNILQLDLEITEAALDATERTIEIVNTLKNHGVMFAIDDFGSGHSSLSRLRLLPVDSLKIGNPFIQDIDINCDDQAIASGIIALAHSLGLRVIGENVEKRSQLKVLRSLNCDEIQGFYFSKPVPAYEAGRLLNKSFS